MQTGCACKGDEKIAAAVVQATLGVPVVCHDFRGTQGDARPDFVLTQDGCDVGLEVSAYNGPRGEFAMEQAFTKAWKDHRREDDFPGLPGHWWVTLKPSAQLRNRSKILDTLAQVTEQGVITSRKLLLRNFEDLEKWKRLSALGVADFRGTPSAGLSRLWFTDQSIAAMVSADLAARDIGDCVSRTLSNTADKLVKINPSRGHFLICVPAIAAPNLALWIIDHYDSQDRADQLRTFDDPELPSTISDLWVRGHWEGFPTLWWQRHRGWQMATPLPPTPMPPCFGPQG